MFQAIIFNIKFDSPKSSCAPAHPPHRSRSGAQNNTFNSLEKYARSG